MTAQPKPQYNKPAQNYQPKYQKSNDIQKVQQATEEGFTNTSDKWFDGKH